MQPLAANAARLNNWLNRRSTAIQIISSSLDPLYLNPIINLARNEDPKAIWDKLAKSDRLRDKLYVVEVKGNFQAELFDPTKQIIQDFVARLDSYKTLIANIDPPIIENDILDKLFQLLLKGDLI